MPYRILSLDGGGPWALMEVRALIALNNNDAKKRGHDVLSEFDLVVANSAGSIVVGGLLENMTLEDLLYFFKNKAMRELLFCPTESLLARLVRRFLGIGPQYSTDAKLRALQQWMEKHGERELLTFAPGIRRQGSAEDTKFLIITFDYDRNRARFFRSYPLEGSSSRQAQKTSLAEAIHASTNAPINYFDKPASFPSQPGRYWDGGITGCNNPVLAGVTEAITLGQKPTDIVALSIGTGSVALAWPRPGEATSPYLQVPSKGGLLNDLHKLAGAILDDPPDMATFVSHHMTGGTASLPAPAHSRIVRMSPLVSPVKVAGAWAAPGGMTGEDFEYLASLDMNATEQKAIDAIARYAELWIESKAPNQPIRMNGDDLTPELGDPWFKDALASWQAVRDMPTNAASPRLAAVSA